MKNHIKNIKNALSIATIFFAWQTYTGYNQLHLEKTAKASSIEVTRCDTYSQSVNKVSKLIYGKRPGCSKEVAVSYTSDRLFRAQEGLTSPKVTFNKICQAPGEELNVWAYQDGQLKLRWDNIVNPRILTKQAPLKGRIIRLSISVTALFIFLIFRP